MAENPPDKPTWKETRDRLTRHLADDARAGTADWLDAFASALLASEIELCDRLIALETARPERLAGLVRSRFRPALEAARADGPVQVVRGLTADSGAMGEI